MRKIDLIIIHCSATRADSDFSAQDVDTAHRYRGFSSWGYHYYIRKSGQVELMRPEDVPGAHARGYNANSLGVCYEGGLDVNGRPPTRGLCGRKRRCTDWWRTFCRVIRRLGWWGTGI